MNDEKTNPAENTAPTATAEPAKGFRKKSEKKGGPGPLGATPTAAQLKGVVSGYTIAIWGTAGAGTVSQGVILEASLAKKADTEPLPDNEGYTIGLVFFNHTDEVELDIIAKDAATQPEQGDAFEAAGITGLVMDSQIMWSYRGLRKMKVRVTKFAKMALS